MITCYFGVPGCGKTTLLTKLAQTELKNMEKGKSPYKHVLTNFFCEGCESIQLSDLGVYDIENCLILLDEITLDADSRDFKSFEQTKKLFFAMHRHVGCDIVYFCQDFSRVDKTIRNLTFDLWYCTKPVVPGLRGFTFCQRIFRNININEYTSELTLGYRFATIGERLFSSTSKILWRKPWYKFFDSFDKTGLDKLEPFSFVMWGKSVSSDLADVADPDDLPPVIVKVKVKR